MLPSDSLISLSLLSLVRLWSSSSLVQLIVRANSEYARFFAANMSIYDNNTVHLITTHTAHNTTLVITRQWTIADFVPGRHLASHGEQFDNGLYLYSAIM